MLTWLIYVLAAGLGGVGAGWYIRRTVGLKSEGKLVRQQKELLLEAKSEALKIKEQAKKELDRLQDDLREKEKDLRRREQSLDRRSESIDEERKKIIEGEKENEEIKSQLREMRKRQLQAIEKMAKLKKEDARELLINQIEKEYRDEVIARIKAAKEEAKEYGETEARKIIAIALGRLATEHTAENTSSSVSLPSDEMKGRIIGKEGRNIQQFEKVTGVDLLVDDTPDTVTVSSFDPVRRAIAKQALEHLVADGRIQPSRIEEVVEKAKTEINKKIKEAGEQAVYETGVAGLHPDLIKILGQLQFRISYGQNVLRHSIETTFIAGMLASEIGADVNISKKAALLHDIGKAIDHEVPGAHHHISMDIARKYGFSETVLNAIGAHHDDIEPKTVEAIIVRVADAISGARPGARRETVDHYVQRLQELENVANSFPGVGKSFAIQAGREVRIIVKPEEIDDLGALKLAKDIAQKIERDLQYPGTIKVNVIREVRAIEIAK